MRKEAGHCWIISPNESTVFAPKTFLFEFHERK